MKILYISQFFTPEITAGAFRAHEQSRVWVKSEEVEVTVYTGNPNYPKGELCEGYENKWIAQENIDGVRVVRAKSIIRKNTNKIGRLISSLGFIGIGLIQLLFNRKILGKKYDVVLGTSGPIFAGILAYIFAVVYRVPFVFEIRDITYLQMIATMNEKNKTSIKIMKFLELFLCKRAQKVIVVTTQFKEELINQGIAPDKIEIVYNGVNLEEYSNRKSIFNNQIVLTYAGTMGISQELMELITFFEELQYPNKQLNLIGEGAQKTLLKNYIEKKQLDNIKLYDAMPKEELSYLLKDTTWGIVKLKYDKHFKATIPSKIFDLMNKGIPILYLGPEGEVSSIIREANAGIALTSLDNKQNARQIEDLIQDMNIEKFSNILQLWGQSGYDYIKKYFDRNQLAEEYLEIIIRSTKKMKYKNTSTSISHDL